MAEQNHRMAAALAHFWKTRFHVPQGAFGCFRGRLLLAWMPQAFKDAVQQPRLLEPEIFQEQG
jgi:hypothetical protein